VNDGEAQNFGVDAHLAHDARYDRADEFLEATTGLWDTWDDDALVLDRESGVFADPDKVHPLDHEGEWFRVKGPLTVPRSPQGRPVLLQAGSSGRGRDFAAKWAELIFTGDPNIDVARSHYKDQKERIGQGGREPGSVKMLPMAYTVIGESRAHAEEREQLFLNELVDPQASLTLLSELMNHDFSGMALDDPITDELVESVSGIRGLVQNLRQHIGATVTLGDLAGHRATLLQGPRFVGTAREVVDQMEEWFEGDACDGFVVAATHVPGAYEDVVRMVVPELQRRDLFRTEYTGATLRENLGLERPAVARHG
jgi:FMN-dependent oxidoreductase (nitrilotriacetate monooxygenase family)